MVWSGMSLLQSRDLKNGRQIIPKGVRAGAEVCEIPREGPKRRERSDSKCKEI